MPFFVPFLIGAAAGGGTLWLATDAADKVTKAALLAGGAYLVYKIYNKG